jgi:hypothetical protein
VPPKLIIEVIGDVSHFEKSMRQASRSTDRFNRSVGQASRGAIAGTLAFRGLGRSVAFASAAFLGGAGLTAAIRGSISAATNLQEQTSKSGVVFGRAASQVQRFADDALGLARDQALETASAFGALFRPLGLTENQAASLSVQLTKLGVDLSSFSNTPLPDALAAIRSGLVGESEPLRRYGVLLSEARVQQEALTQTGKTNVTQLTNQEKVLARVSLIMRDAQQASGDYERTSGGLANQQRELSKNIRNLQIQLGEALIPVVLKIVKRTNQWLENTENTDKVVAAFEGTLNVFVSTAEVTINVVDRLADAFGGLQSTIDRLTPGQGSHYSLVDLGRDLTDVGRAAKAPSILDLIGVTGGGGGDQVARVGREMRKALDQIERLRTGRTLSLREEGIAGGAVAGRPAPKTRGLEAFIPKAITLELARARTELQERAALGRELAAVNKALRRDITVDDRIALEEEKTQIIGSLRSMNEAEARERKQGLDRAAALAKQRLEDEKRRNRDRIKAAKEARAKLREAMIAEIAVDPGLGFPGEILTVGQVNAAMAAREQVSQFRALGLTATGEAFAPTGRAIAGRADRLTDRLKGTVFDTDANRNKIAQIRKVLSGQFGQLTRETRLAMSAFLDAIEDPLKERGAAGTGFKKLRPQALAARLGIPLQDLSVLQRRAILQNLATIGPGGTVPAGRSAAFAGTTYVLNNPTFSGVNDIGKFEAALAKKRRGRANVRRGA